MAYIRLPMEEFFDQIVQPKADIGRALERGEFQLHYQPVVALDRDRIVGFEALVRWMHPIRGVVYPGEFLPLIESSGLTLDLTKWIVQEVCRQVSRWQAVLRDTMPFTVSTNFPVPGLTNSALMKEVGAMVSSPSIPPDAVRLELTEQDIFEQPELVTRSLSMFKEMGIGVVIDDFGFQYASLRHVTNYQVVGLKMAHTLVQSLRTDPASSSLGQATVVLGNSLGIEVVAKGVEKRDQLAAVRELQCPYAQGFFFWPPQDPDVAFLSFCETESQKSGSAVAVSRLQAFDIFAGLSPEDLQMIAQTCRELAVPQDTLLIRQGQVGTRVYLLEQGTVSIYKGSGEVQHFLKALDAPAVIGEMAVADPERIRTANVRSQTDLRLLSLPIPDFLLFLKRIPALAQKLRQLMEQRSR